MAKIHSLAISNFRGIKKFHQIFKDSGFICIIGRGDSGKTTILDAISYVLSPSWNLSFLDTDFYECNVENQIEIEASVYDLPKNLIREDKFGLYIRGLDQSDNTIHDDIEDDHIGLLTIRLCVGRSLEPTWYVVNDRQEPIEIKARDRSSLNVFLVSDYVDKHFSWNYGTPLYSLLKQEESYQNTEKNNILIEALREAKVKIDDSPFNHLDNVTEQINKNASALGIDIGSPATTVDFRDFLIKDGKVCLHDGKIPFRLKGKGSKRLISIAIQTALAQTGGIILIDEIEHGLEPDRAQHLSKTLKKNNSFQIFITTHSRDVLVELEAKDLFLMRKSLSELKTLNHDSSKIYESLQKCVRSNPEAFFAKKILVCEGATEVGICRSINDYRIQESHENASLKGVRFVDGTGSGLIDYAKVFKETGYDVCVFCDSDDSNTNKKKPELTNLGIEVVDCSDSNSIENQVFADLPWEGVKELIEYRISQKGENSVASSMKTQMNDLSDDWKNCDSLEVRQALAAASVIKEKEWFKRIDHGMAIGEVCCRYLTLMEKTNRLKQQFDKLIEWIG